MVAGYLRIDHSIEKLNVDGIVHVSISRAGELGPLSVSMTVAPHLLVVVGPPGAIIQDEVIVAPPAGLEALVICHGLRGCACRRSFRCGSASELHYCVLRTT